MGSIGLGSSWTISPVAQHRSSLRFHPHHWADMTMDPSANGFGLSVRAPMWHLMRLQYRATTCVPAFALNLDPFGNVCVVSFVKGGFCSAHLPLNVTLLSLCYH